MATIRIKRFKDDAIVNVDLNEFYQAIQKRQIDKANDQIRIGEERYILSSIAHNYEPLIDDVRKIKVNNTIKEQYYNGTEWVDTGSSYDI